MLTLNHFKNEFLFAVGHHSKAFMPPLSTNKLPISYDCISHTLNGSVCEGLNNIHVERTNVPQQFFPAFMSCIISQMHTCKHRLAESLRDRAGSAPSLSSASAYISLKKSNIPAPVSIYPVRGPCGYTPGPLTLASIRLERGGAVVPSSTLMFMSFNSV